MSRRGDDERLARLKRAAREMPTRPGVYLHKNRSGEVIYVGKARNLRNRVSSYLVGKGARDSRTLSLVQEIDRTDIVTTGNELEAILLENNLIKTHQPRYNVLLRDDKTYPYIRLTLSEDFPRAMFTRRVDRSKGDPYYGPFFAGTARRILKLIQDQFRLRSCDLEIEEGKDALPRPCLYYDMHRCPGPCVSSLVSKEEYRRIVEHVDMFLSGRDRELVEELKKRMYSASDEEKFEMARYYRDLIRTVEKIHSEQKVASAAKSSVDVWGFHEEEGDVAVQIFVLRDGNLVDRRELFWEKLENFDARYFLTELLQRYYDENLFIPPEILVPLEIDDQDLIEEWLGSKRGARVGIRVPRRGQGVDRLSMATRNARLAHESRFRKSQRDRLRVAAERLGQILDLDAPVSRVESFDISNFQGTDSVAGMVVFENGELKKSDYRLFNIRSVEGSDDFRSIGEAVERRYRRLRDEERGLPDLVLIDGGKGQLNAATAALDSLGIQDLPIVSIAKREEEIYRPGEEEPIQMPRHEPALQLLQLIRDETHRYSVTSHRRRRSKRTLRSELADIEGIGPKRQKLLMEHFGSLSAVKQASRQDLAKLLGPRVGGSVYEQLHA